MSQEIKTTSWGNRIIQSLMGILIGFVLIIGSFILIFWNEGHGLHTAQSLEQVQKVLITVPASPLDKKNNSKAVYVTGLATTDETLKDPLLNISEKAIKLERKVEMYQWKEDTDTKTTKKLGGSEEHVTTYSYKEVWSDSLIDSSEFHDKAGHENPTQMPIKSKIQQAKKVTVGDFTLSSELIDLMSGGKPVDFSDMKDLSKLQDKFHKPIHHDDEALYVGTDPQTPKIGDLKISADVIFPQTVSIIAEQQDNILQAYVAPAGKSIALLEMGQQSSQAMIQAAERENQLMTWLIRAGSLILMMIGIGLIFAPLSVVADVIPFIGSIVGVGTGLIAFVGGLFLWSIATAIAWFIFRPLWSIGLIVIVGVIGYVLINRKVKTVPAEKK